MTKMEVSEALISAQNSDYNIRKKAENELELLELENIQDFFKNLSNILVGEKYDNDIRRLAGLVLKNRLETKKKSDKGEFSYKWLLFVDVKSRKEIKNSIFNVFKSFSRIARRTASQVIAKITSIELSNGEQNDILLIFSKFLENRKPELYFYHSIIETIEFICQETGSDNFPEQIFKKYAIQIIKILLISINETEENYEEIKIAALNGLLSIIDFIDEIFKEKLYRNFILDSICNQIKSNNVSIRAVSFETLDKIAQNYYCWLDDYISLFYNLTIQTIEKDKDLVILQAIELWTTIANEEFEMNMDEYQALNEGRYFLSYSRQYILKASSYLPDLLLNCIKTKNREECNEEWNCCNAAGACLNIMSQASPREIIQSVISFIDKNIYIDNSQFNIESITLAFIAIFDGIGSKVLYSYVKKMLVYWLLSMEKTSSNLYDILSLTVGKISHSFSCMVRHFTDRVVQILLNNLISKQITYNPCWCLNEILQPFGREGVVDWCFEAIASVVLKKILFRTYNNKITNELFEIISSLIINSSIRNEAYIYVILPYLLSNLNMSFFSNQHTNLLDTRETQSYLCRIIGCAIQKYGKKINPIFMEKIIDTLSQITFDLDSNSDYFLEEEVLACIGAIVQTNKIKSLFKIKKWIGFLIKCIEHTENNEINTLAIGVMGDLCRTIKVEIKPHVEKILDVMINKLNKNSTDKKIKPAIITCIGDIALTHEFSSKYFNIIVESFKKIIISPQLYYLENDNENLEINLKIKEAILEGITGAIQGFQDSNQLLIKQNLFEKLKWISDFIYDTICKDRLFIIVKTSIGLIGDLSLSSHQIKQVFQKECWIFQLLSESKHNKDDKIKIIGVWAFDSIYN